MGSMTTDAKRYGAVAIALHAARFTHAAFYVLIIAMPLTGWLRTSSGNYPLIWFGLVDLPKFPLTAGSAEARLASQSRDLIEWIMLLLILVHVAVTLHHHFRLRDAIFLRTLPTRS